MGAIINGNINLPKSIFSKRDFKGVFMEFGVVL